MTEQHEGEHEWVPRVLDWEDVDGARCSIPFCDAQMDDKEMSRRLNEYETLKKATELVLANLRTLTHRDLENGVHEQLADILDGKDD